MLSKSKQPLLSVQNLVKYFPIRKGIFSRVVANVHAVDDVSFDIPEGETLSLVGESGCGKTTTGRTLLRLIEPTSGKIFYNGTDIANASTSQMRALRKDMQIVFQDPYGSLNPRMTIQSIVEEGLIIQGGYTASERKDLVCQTLKKCGLDPSYISRYPHEFSGGQRQRVCIARALVLSPKFVVLDEPISALDVSIQAQIINLLADLRDEYNLTYLFISHDLSVVEYLSNHVAVMYLGKIVEMADKATLYGNPVHPYTQALLSAIPTVDPSKRRSRIVLQGDVPSPINPPQGCHFHPRCPRATERCRTEAPQLINIGTEDNVHQVRCFLAEKDFGTPGQSIQTVDKKEPTPQKQPQGKKNKKSGKKRRG